MTTVICPKCGTENPGDAVKCSKCRIILKMALEHAAKQAPIEQSTAFVKNTSREKVQPSTLKIKNTLIDLHTGFLLTVKNLNSRNKTIIVIAIVGLILASLLIIFGKLYLTEQINRGWDDILWNRYFRSWKRDPQGQVWFNLYGRMIKTHDGKQFEIPIESGDKISGFAFDQDGRLWVSTEEPLILVQDAEQEWRTFSPKSPIPFTLEVIDGGRRAWGQSGDFFGYIELDEDTSEFDFNSSRALYTDSPLTTYAIDSNGRLWVAHDDALKVFGEKGIWIKKINNIGKFYGRVHRPIASDTQGGIWIYIAPPREIVYIKEEWPKRARIRMLRGSNRMDSAPVL